MPVQLLELLRYSEPPTQDVANFLPASHSIPQRIACFSVSEDRTIQVNDQHALMSFVPPAIGSSMRQGFDQFEQASGADPHHNHPNRLDRILRMILESNVLSSGVFPRPQAVVAFRGVYKKIMMPKTNVISLNMCMHQGTIYLEEYDPTPTKLYTNVPVHEFIGKRFEELCTGNINELHLHQRFYLGMTWSLADMNLFLAGEIDCKLEGNSDASESDTIQYVELKSKRIRSDGTFHKLPLSEWYLQSHMTGVANIFVGHHDGEELKQTKMVKVDEIKLDPDQLQDRYDWLLRVLKSLRSHCLKSSEAAVWRVEIMKKKMVTVTQISEDELEKINGSEERVGILPAWFIEGLKRESATLEQK
ncbi:hypothetical protein C8J56DRAFT_922455 [Mycena floridula]|nr:hypothetical protein C8J56DRAFT_922455 [Mycena floridula]